MRSTFRARPDDYLLFLGRFTAGKGVLQAIEVARRVGMKLILVAAEDAYYRDTVAPHVDGTEIVYYGEADHAAKVRLYGGARALLYPVQAREPFGLVLAEAMACGTPVAALDRGAVREVVDDGVTGLVFNDLAEMIDGLRGRARARSPARARPGRRQVRRRADGGRVHRRVPAGCGGTPWRALMMRRRVSRAGPCSRSSRIPTTSRWRAAARWRVWRTMASAWCCCARHTASADNRRIPSVARGPELGRVREHELQQAAKVLGISEVILLDHPDGELRWANVEKLHEQIVQAITTYAPDVVITFDEDGLYWHLDHIGIHERTVTAVKSFGAAAPSLFYVTIPRGVMREVTDTAVANGWVPPGSMLFGITPDAFGIAAEPHSLTVNVTNWVPRKLAALRCHQTQMGPGNPFARLDLAEATRWLAIEQFRRDPTHLGRIVARQDWRAEARRVSAGRRQGR